MHIFRLKDVENVTIPNPISALVGPNTFIAVSHRKLGNLQEALGHLLQVQSKTGIMYEFSQYLVLCRFQMGSLFINILCI
ncbi:hypothetical protein Csa_013430 [Cucumis sativus]|uniref:Uncharacterized protein n=1 Tax=Cucumis sativus TaxID=3659 RepID=A0A0A0LSN6_CUCSA|nr:hypothetical protein Csa_013430 [Cucumis sativus]